MLIRTMNGTCDIKSFFNISGRGASRRVSKGEKGVNSLRHPKLRKKIKKISCYLM